MMTSRLLDICDNIFPGFGFFGSQEPFWLNIIIGQNATCVKISVKANNHEFLNINSVDFYDLDGKLYDRADIIKSVAISSIYGDISEEECLKRIISGHPIHTKKEEEPSVKIFFHTSTPMGRVTIRNRSDINGRRSAFLTCKVECGEELVLFFKNTTEAKKLQALEKLLHTVGLEIDFIRKPETLNPEELIEAAVLEILELSSEDFSFLELCSFLPLHSAKPALTSFQTTVCAAIVIKLLKGRSSVGTARLRPIKNVLCTPSAIKRVESEVSRLMSLQAGTKAQVVFSKHLIQRSGILERADEYLDAIDQAVHIFEELGITIMLCYGSLLGAIRDGGFIPHDDDVDFLIYDGSGSREEAIEKKEKLIKALAERGYRSRNFSGENFHVSFGRRSLDFFICWKDSSRVFLMMESYLYRPIDHAIVYPPSEIDFFGRKLKAPSRPEAFLAERYGEGWKIPDPFHEWPWKIFHNE